MARCRQLLIEHLPDVHEQLLGAGVQEAPISTQMPPTLTDTTARPGDERLTMLMTRRSTFDWVLQRAVVDQPQVTLRRGVAVTGLVAVSGEPPHVTGVRTNSGDLSAELVVDAAGRRSPIDQWLKSIGARSSATAWAECGVVYFSRHYRLREGAALPALPTTRIVAALDEFTVGIWGGDNNTMQLAVAPLAMDHRFKTLRYPEVFTAVLRTIPTYAKWLDAHTVSDRVTFAQLRTAGLFDPTAFRGLWRVMGMISQPGEVYTDPQVVARTHAALDDHDSDPSIVQPSREHWLAALNTGHG